MNAGLIVDICLVVLTAFIIIKFTIKGFFSSVMDVAKLFLSVLIAFLVRTPVSKLFCSLFMDKAMHSVVESSLNAYLESDASKISFDITNLAESAPEFFEKFLTRFGLDYDRFVSDLNELTTNHNPDMVEPLAQNVGGAASMLLSLVLALIVGFIVVYLILIIVAKLLENLMKFDGVKQANRWLGALVGVIISLLIMWGVTMGLEALVEFVGPVAPNVITSDLTERSMIVGIFKHISLVDFIKSKIYG